MTAIWAILTGNPIARALAKVLGLVLAVLTFGAWQRRQGAAKARQKQAEADAKAFKQTTKDVTYETISTDPVDTVRERMRDRAGKP